LGAALSAGEQGIADALFGLTRIPVALEDRFGNLRCWADPERLDQYDKQPPDRRNRLLHRLAGNSRPVPVGDRVLVLVQPRADILGVLTLIDRIGGRPTTICSPCNTPAP
jgi:hypothetical protein